MAKIGEGDARWIVSERQDGTNVHNWHWSEKDVMPWARQRFSELLGGVKLASSVEGLEASISGSIEVEGDAVINNRKNKLIPAYELEIKGGWTGTLKADGGAKEAVHGLWKLPYLAEENADEDPELQVTTATEAAPQKKAKTILLKNGKKIILEKVRTFVREMSQGGPAANSRDAPAPHAAAAGKPKLDLHAAQPNKEEAKAKSVSKQHTGGKRKFESTEKFYASARDIYACFTDAKCISAYTQSPAKANPKEGGVFEIFGGSVVGKYTSITKDKEILLDWRFRNWQESDVSKVHIILEEPEEGTTILTIKHTQIPEEDSFGNGDVLQTTTSGWKMQIFHKIRAVFGYGLGL